MHADCVTVLSNKAIRPNAIVIDAGAGDGAWTLAVLAAVPGVEIHCFEPDLAKYRQLLIALASPIATGQVIPHNATVGWTDPTCGANWPSLKDYAAAAGLKRLPFVRLGDGVPVSAAISGCSDLIRHGHLEFILATANAEQEAELASSLLAHRYELFRHSALGDQVLCASDRFRSTIKNELPQSPDVLNWCRDFEVSPKGVIHVGAGEGHDARQYVSAAIGKSLLIEANPGVYHRLQENVAGLTGVTAVHCAANDQPGTIEVGAGVPQQNASVFSLSLTAPKPLAAPKKPIMVLVPAKTIDQIVQETGHSPDDYNVINLNIRGSGLATLRGAHAVLPNIHAVFAKLDYDEQRPGYGSVEEIDSLLETNGFDRVATTSPHSASRAVAFYVRRRHAPLPRQSPTEFMYTARNTIVGGWLSLASASLREAWEGATGNAHRHLVQNGVCQLPLSGTEDHRIVELLEKNLKTSPKDRRLQLLLAMMLYVPADQIAFPAESLPGWFKKSFPGLGTSQAAMAA